MYTVSDDDPLFIKLADPKLGKYLIRAIKVRIYLIIFPG